MEPSNISLLGLGRLAGGGVLVRMIEEYARHAGHADVLRERIDGRVGQQRLLESANALASAHPNALVKDH